MGDISDCTFDSFAHTVGLRSRRLFLPWYEGKIIAISIFRFSAEGLCEYTDNCSLDEFIRLRPNDLLQWKGIQWACANRLRRHSLQGDHPFLARFGGALVGVVCYRLDRTLFRRHDLAEWLRAKARSLLCRAPFLDRNVRKLIGKTPTR